MADGATGYRRLAQYGNLYHNLAGTLELPTISQYDQLFWSVQSVDGALAGSAFASEQSFAPPFTEVSSGLLNVKHGLLSWGDYDNDGDLDLLLAGKDSINANVARIYRNDAGVFVDIEAGLTGVSSCGGAWGDYDNDDDLDILLTGSSTTTRLSRVYRNDAGSFSAIGAGLPGIQKSAVAWGDYDNDGDLDILLSGEDQSATGLTRVFRNDVGVFTDIDAGLVGVYSGDLAWGDYDNDGDLDIVLTGYIDGERIARVYRNDGGLFSDSGASLTPVSGGAVVWGDYDDDGDLDILLAGWDGSTQVTYIYRNDAGIFTDTGADLDGITFGTASWADFDNDGDLDILLAGSHLTVQIVRIYRKLSGDSYEIAADLEGLNFCDVAWGDGDNDGDLDLVVCGDDGVDRVTRFYRNNSTQPNTPPSAPGNLSIDFTSSTLTLNWSQATDPETPPAGLSYNVRLGTSPGGLEIVSAMADPGTGNRRTVQLGNAQQNLSWSMSWQMLGQVQELYGTVQAVDHAFAGSPFCPEIMFLLAPSLQSIADVPGDQGLQVSLTWHRSGRHHLLRCLRIRLADYRLQCVAAGRSEGCSGCQGRYHTRGRC